MRILPVMREALKSIDKTQYWELLAALLILGWRISQYPVRRIFWDWVPILCLYWIFTIFCSRSPRWASVTAGVMALLMGACIFRQTPFLVALLKDLQ
jgi:hypothetical protein